MVTLVALTLLASGGQKPVPVRMVMAVAPELRALVDKISSNTKSGNWAEAKQLAGQLPKLNPAVGFEFTGAPSAVVEMIEEVRDEVLDFWSMKLVGFKAKVGTGDDLVIRYADVKSTKLSYSLEKNQPRLSVVFPLVRGKQPRVVNRNDVRTDVLYAIAKYFGVTDNPSEFTIAGRKDDSDAQISVGMGQEAIISKGVATMTETIRKAIEAKTAIEFASPIADLKTHQFDLEAVTQGDLSEMEIVLQNTGTGDLVADVSANCGCVIPQRRLVVAPGQTVRGKVQLDTIEFTGDLTRLLTVVTNDSSHPYFQIPIKVKVNPRFFFISPPGQVFVTDRPGQARDIYVILASGKPTNITINRVDGATAEATIEKWSGDVRDPNTGIEYRGQTGYKIHLEIGKQLVPGRAPGRVMLRTDDPKFPSIGANFYVQEGIVAMPDSLYFGEVSSGQIVKSLISRPGVPYKIIQATSSNPHFSVKVETIHEGWDYRIAVSYDGKARSGTFEETVILKTDDPKQAQIKIPFRGTVR